MNENVRQQRSTILDTVKLIISVLVLLGGIAAYYYFVQTSIFLRVLMILASIPIALIFSTRPHREKGYGIFFKDHVSRLEKLYGQQDKKQSRLL